MRSVPTQPLPFRVALLQPKYWPTWAGFALLRLSALLPLRLLALMGAALGLAFYAVHAPRRRIAATNIALCFPALDARAQRQLVRSHFRALGQAMFDVALAWWAAPTRLRRLCRVEGGEHLARARARGGVILLAPHFAALELGGMRLAIDHTCATMYKRAKNELATWFFMRRRPRFGGVAVEQRAGARAAVRAIKDGLLFYYLPDQDLGAADSVFVPFFGVPTATVPALSRLAALGDAQVLPFFTYQRPWGAGYDIVIGAPLADFPSADPVRDATAMNAAIEVGIARAPAQYFWVHKRFKTTPPGAAPRYRR